MRTHTDIIGGNILGGMAQIEASLFQFGLDSTDHGHVALSLVKDVKDIIMEERIWREK